MPSPSAVLPDLLAAGHPVTATETAVVAAYCRTHQLAPVPGGGVEASVASVDDVDPQLRATIQEASEQGPGWTLDDLVAAFEMLVPAAEARQFGAVFTPEAITAFMATEVCDRADARGVSLATATVVDPAAGCGALLVAMLRELHHRTGIAPSTLATNLTGIDISADSIRRARLLIELACLTLGDPHLPQPRLLVADALAADLDDLLTASAADTTARMRGAAEARFDIVIGNPPYVRYQQLPDQQRADLQQRWQVCGPGNFNLYFPFFEVAHRLAAPTGTIALITPNGFFTSLSGKPLRAWMTQNRYLDAVLDFGHHRVFHAMTYTAITFASPKQQPEHQPAFAYLDLDGLPALADLPPDWATTHTATISWDDLTLARWRLVGPTRAEAIRTIATTGRPLREVAQVRYGVATCRDKLYLLDGSRDAAGHYVKVHNNVTYSIEPGVTMPVVKVAGIQTAEDLAATTTRLLYPYRLIDTDAGTTSAQVVDEDTLAQRYPGAYTYLCAIREELARRDRGNKTYAAWYAYARTQGLLPTGPRLLTPLYAGRPRFLDDAGTGLFLNGCAVTATDDAWAETLEWVLNSGICHFYIESTANAISNGFFAYQKTQLAGLGVPDLTDDQRTELRAAGTPGAIDDLLADIYGIDLPAQYRRA